MRSLLSKLVQRRIGRRALLLAVATSWAGCSQADLNPSEGGTKVGDLNNERAGANCFACHSQFKLAGTVRDPSIEYIDIRDGNGVQTRLYPNSHRNFFRHHVLEPPFDVTMVAVDGSKRIMRDAPHGSCNACHHDLPGGAGEL